MKCMSAWEQKRKELEVLLEAFYFQNICYKTHISTDFRQIKLKELTNVLNGREVIWAY